MKQNKLARVGALALSALMLVATMVAPVFAADEPQLVTTTNAITIEGTGRSGESVTGHDYAIIKVMDKYQIGTDANDNPLYQYKLTQKFGEKLGLTWDAGTKTWYTDAAKTTPAGGISIGNFTVDANSGKITYDSYVLDGANDTEVDPAENADTSALNLNENTSKGAEFATAVRRFVKAQNIAADVTIAGGNTTEELTYGYYVIYEAANNADPSDGLIATKPILVNLDATTPQITVKDNDAVVDIDKTIAGSYTDDFAIGDTVPYTVEGTLPIYEADVITDSMMYKISDTLSTGLTFNDDIVFTALSPDENHSVSWDDLTLDGAKADVIYTHEAGSNHFELSLTPTFLKEHQGWTIHVSYSGTLNENAVISGDGNTNDVSLEFSNDPNNPEHHQTKEPETTATAYTYSIDLQKKDGSHDTYLEGATFKLQVMRTYDDSPVELKAIKTEAVDVPLVYVGVENNIDIYRPAMETDDEEDVVTQFTTNGREIRFIGLDSGDYVLTEVSAPAGYSKISGDIPFTIAPQMDDKELTGKSIVTTTSNAATLIDDKNADATEFIGDEAMNINVLVKNYEGISLPATGAMTSLFVMGAGVAVVGGGLFFGLRRKKEDEE